MRIALCEKQVRRSYSGKEEYDINRVSRFESETIDVTFAVNSPQAPSRHMRAFAQGCCIPTLTRFTNSHCARPRRQRHLRRAAPPP